MIRSIFIGLLTVFLVAPLTNAQPLKKHLPFSRQFSQGSEIHQEESLQMLDFFYQPSGEQDNSIIQAMRTKPGFAFLGSAIVPGLGQAANSKWIRAGAYFAADIIFLALHIHNQNRAQDLQRQYEQFADDNWSVVTYSQWLVDYHKQNGIYQQNEHIQELEQQVSGSTPAYNTTTDWNVVNIELLRRVENETPFVNSDGSVGNIFSHEMPAYGSQQYYELISKYYQYGPGWNDFGVNRDGQALDSRYQLAWDGSDMPPHFLEGARLADQFNDKYRIAGNMLSYMILNHVVSAFDAFISVKLKNNRLETETSFLGPRQMTLKYHF